MKNIDEDLVKAAGGPWADCPNCENGLIEVLGKQGLETRTCKKCRGTGKVKNIRGILG